MSRRAGIIVNIQFCHGQIEDPTEYALRFINFWGQKNRETLKLYEKSKPLPPIGGDEVRQRLSFDGRFKTKPHRSITLKSSLKGDNDIAHLMFENNSIFWKTLHPSGWGNIASQVRLELPFKKILCQSGYSQQDILDLFINLISDRKVDTAYIHIDTEGYFGIDGVYSKLQDWRTAKKEFSIISWCTFISNGRLEAIYKLFSKKEQFRRFCIANDLEVVTAPEMKGIIIKMKGDMEDTCEHYDRILSINRDFFNLI